MPTAPSEVAGTVGQWRNCEHLIILMPTTLGALPFSDDMPGLWLTRQDVETETYLDRRSDRVNRNQLIGSIRTPNQLSCVRVAFIVVE